MTPAHLHLILNHLPVVAVPLAAALIAVAMRQRSRESLRLALATATVAGALSLPAYFTGEPAEDQIESTAGVEKDAIEEHEDGALFAAIFGSVLALTAGAGWYAARRADESGRGLAGKLTVAALAVALFDTTVLARVAYLGGLIRHQEITEKAP